MKKQTYILIALLAAGTTIGAYAEEATAERDGSRKAAHRAKMMEQFDKDGDGQLSGKERKHAKKAREKRSEMECEKRGERGEGKERGEREGKGERQGKGERGSKGGKGGGKTT